MKNFYYLLIALLCSTGLTAQCPISVSGTQTICVGQTTTLTATSTAASYIWNPGGINSASATLSPTVTTTYTVIGTDGICTDSSTVTVFVNPLPTITANSSINPICQYQQPTGLSASGAMTYTWSPGLGLSSTSGSSTTCSAVSTTMYTVSGTAVSGCIGTATLVVSVVIPPTLSFSVTPATCGGSCNGSITSFVTGSPGVTYTWSPTGSNAPTINGVCGGSYTCTVIDANGCFAADAAFVPSTGLTFSTTIVPAACGQANGSITIDSIQGGSSPYTFMYTYNGQTSNSPSNVISNLPAGVYSVIVQDTLGGCNSTQTLTVNNSNFTAQLNTTPAACNQCDGSITSSMVGGTPPYTYAWSNGSAGSSLNNLCIGNYQLSVTDSFGCFTSASISVISPSAPVIQVDTVQPITCNGVNTGSISVSVSGGSPPYSYAWSTTPVQTTNTATNLQPGSYLLTVTDNLACSALTSVYVPNNNNIYVYFPMISPANCGTTGSATVTAAGGQSPYTFSWSNGVIGNSAINLSQAAYTVTATDANGCSGNGSFTLPSYCQNTIRGTVYFDANQNCIQDVGEQGLPGRYIYDPQGNSWASSDANGNYTLLTTSPTNTLVIYDGYYQTYLSPTCPSTNSLSVTFSQAGDTLTGNNFGYWTNPNYFDLSIHPGFTSGHPGMQKNYWIYFANNSLNTQNALIRFTYDPQLQYDSSNSGGVHYPAQHKIEWTYNNVPANKPWDWVNDPRAYFTVPATVPITANLTSLFEILPVSGDAQPVDNTVSTFDAVTGSRDPNSKSVYPSGNIYQSDSVLLYKVHFQNNGNDTAYRVVVVDTLSPFLDPGTIDPGAASHPYTFSLSGAGICTWTFDAIMLPDSLTNEPASNGYFTYTVKQKPNNPLGSVIKNTAYIYFDYNPAVITNTTINTITSPVAVPEYMMNAARSELMIYPNPANDLFVARYTVNETGSVQIEIRNIMGELLRTHVSYGHKKGMQMDELSASGLANGVYLVRVICGAKQQTQKLIIQK